MLTLTGAVDRVVFRSPDDRFVVIRFRMEGVGEQRTYDDITTLVGDLGDVSDGALLRVGGEWEQHPRHGRHFRVDWSEQRLPSTAAGIEKFLGSGVIKGIGPATAQRIVKCFGERTLEVIEIHPDQLSGVPKLSKRRADLLLEGWRSQHKVRELMLFLRSHDLAPHLGRIIRDRYGDQAVSVIQRDPYQLAHEVQGIGFKTADAMAVRLGLPSEAPSRLAAGLKHVLEEAVREGHVFLPSSVAIERTLRLLGVRPELLQPAILDASRHGLVVLEDEALYLTPFFHAERNVARRLDRIRTAPSFLADLPGGFDADETARRATTGLGITLAARQMEAVIMALREKAAIITGGPGTGKTMCLHAIIAALDEARVPYSLCAPTGRAAKRITAATGRNASTIHRLLGYQPNSDDFAFDSEHLLPEQFVIVDEVSMLDTLLFNNLLKAVPKFSHLLLVGDADQLPSVGPGNVLHDLLDSGVLPSVTLNELFRQAKNSRITVAAHQIRQGEMPDPESDGDLYLIRVDGAERAQTVVKEMVSKRIPSRFNLDAKRDIQVLTPTHRGPAGVMALNQALQALVNPAGPSYPLLQMGSHEFRCGDKVMQVRNNYEKDVYNGDVGVVSGIDVERRALSVRFGEVDEFRDVGYEYLDLGDLALSYAVSIHKAQGSEFACVVMPLLNSHYPLLQRNLLYTGITRARQLCILVYERQALQMAVRQTRLEARYTRLSDRVRDLDNVVPELQGAPLEAL